MISPGHHVFPASFPQRQLWLVEQTEEPGATYNVPFGLRLRGDLNREALDASFRYLTARHEVLRTTFAMQGQELCQIIRPEAAVVVRSGELDDGAEPVEAKLGRQLEREALARFDLEAGPLVRAALFRLGPLDHALVVTMHHIIADAWSVDVFLEELASAYDCLVQGREPELPPLPIQYADFAAWQVEAATADHLAPALGYWRKQLAASLPELQLPTDRPRPAEQRHRGGQVRVVIPEQLTAPLRALATEAGATLFMALFASFQVLLYRHTGQTDIITGTPIAGRHRPEATGLIGFFLNMLAIRTDLSGNPSFPELLAQVRRTLLDAYAAQDLPFEQLVEALQVARERSRHPVFQTVFVLLGSEHAVPSFRGLTVQPLAVPPGAHSKFDLQLAVTDTGKGLQVEFEYDSDLFDVATIEAMAERYRVLLGSLSASSTPIAHLPVLTAAETTRLLDTWNATTTDYPRDRSLSELFEQQVDVSPGAVALLEVSEAEGGPPRVHSYLELDRAANRLAHHLAATA